MTIKQEIQNMRNLLKLFVLLLCSTATVSLTSCLDSDSSDSYLDAASQKQYQSLMAGTKTGKMRFYKQSESVSSQTVKYDSVSMRAVVKTDSTISVTTTAINDGRDLVNCLDSAIIYTTAQPTYKSLFEAIRDYEGTPTISSTYYIPYSSYVQSNQISFIAAMSIKAVVNYDGADHYVYFFFNPWYGAGSGWQSGYFQLAYLLSAVYVTDTNKTASELKSSEQISSSSLRTIGMLFATK